jgi:hypothetical protein
MVGVIHPPSSLLDIHEQIALEDIFAFLVFLGSLVGFVLKQPVY